MLSNKHFIEKEWNNNIKKWKHVVSPGRAGAREDFWGCYQRDKLWRWEKTQKWVFFPSSLELSYRRKSSRTNSSEIIFQACRNLPGCPRGFLNPGFCAGCEAELAGAGLSPPEGAAAAAHARALLQHPSILPSIPSSLPPSLPPSLHSPACLWAHTEHPLCWQKC